MKEPILERIERWYDYASVTGVRLERILIHPDDKSQAPREYMGLPVVAIGEKS